MNKIYIENDNVIDLDNLKMLSTAGSEVTVYCDDTLVYKIYRGNYRFTHKTVAELDYLSSLNTYRILMPKQKLFKNGKLVGYTMPFIVDKKNIFKITTSQLLKELSILQNDVETISNAGIRLIDINRENSIYNNGIYLIDFGNFKINDINDMFYELNGKKYFIDNDNRCLVPMESFKNPTNLYFIKKWNYYKLNSLICEMLFMNNPDIYLYVLRKTIEFFKEKRISQNELYDLRTYEQYFDKNLLVGGAIKNFITKYISINKEEQDEITSLMKNSTRTYERTM